MEASTDKNKQVAVRAKPGAVALPGKNKQQKPVKVALEEEEFTEASTHITLYLGLSTHSFTAGHG